jgi:PAS domain S-box-containing protein
VILTPKTESMGSNRFEQIIEIADEAIISVDARQLICLFNQGAERIFGYDNKEILGQHLNILLPERFRIAHSNHIDSFEHESVRARTMNERKKIVGVRKNGEEFPAIGSILKTGDGSNRNFTVMLHDISAIEELRVLLQERISSLELSNHDMAQEKQRLRRTEDLLDRLLKQAHSK